MATEWGQKGDKKMSMISHEGLVGETFICSGFRATDAWMLGIFRFMGGR